LFSVAIVTGLLGAIELSLWALGVPAAGVEGDPFVGFAGNVPLFVRATDDDGNGVRVTAANKRSLFNIQQFAESKPSGTVRIFCLGGSTTYGRPYSSETSFCGWLKEFLPIADPATGWEVINAGGVSYASYRVARVAEELASYEPDIFLIYTGQNEFLEARTYREITEVSPILRATASTLYKTRTFSSIARVMGRGPDHGESTPTSSDGLLPDEVRTRLENSIGPQDYRRDDGFRAQVLDHFRFNLERLMKIAGEADATPILITPASNLRDCSPFKSDHRTGFNEDDATRWRLAMEELVRARQGGDPSAALAAADRALIVDPRFAQLHFVRGHILTALGRHDDARRAFRNAINEDVCPLRAPDEVTQLVRQIATDGDVLRIDFDRLLESLATDGIPGADLFFDHVHPTIEGHRRLALAIVEEMVDAGLLSLHADWGDDTIDDVSRSVTGRIDDDAHGAALRNLAKVMGWAGKTEEALRLVDRAIQLGPSDAEAHYNRGLLLLRLGRDGEAEGSLLAAVRLRADFAEAYYDLALLRQSREAFADAESDYLQAIKLRPRYTQAHNNLGVVYERLGEGERARASYRRALELEPDHADANHNLGWLMARKGEGAEALPYLRLAVERRPGSAPFRQSLAETLEKEGFAAEAQEIREQAIPISGDGP